MKKILFTLLFGLCVILSQPAQALDNFWYTGVSLSNTGQVQPATTVSVRITIENSGGTLYQETHAGIITDQFGGFLIEVGTGSVVSGALGPVTTTADTRIMAETNTGSGYVLSAVNSVAQVMSSNVLNNIEDIAWGLEGNAGTNPADNFIGTTDNQPLTFKVNNTIAGQLTTGGNTSYGLYSLQSNTTGFDNTGSGSYALQYNTSGIFNTGYGSNALKSNSTGNNNTANGAYALFYNTSSNNTASGAFALNTNTTGGGNTASGSFALANNTTGSNNTASGAGALNKNTTGSDNTASGVNALQNNTTGLFNTASGASALLNNTTGSSNTATGILALRNNTTGDNNTAIGAWALFQNSTGYRNTASGYYALHNNTTGNYNTASGQFAMYSNTTGSSNTASGSGALSSNTTGYDNSAYSTDALSRNTTGYYNVAVGSYALNQNTTARMNTAAGTHSLYNNTGSENTAFGHAALYSNTTGYYNSALGRGANHYNTTGYQNTALGYYAGNEDIGSNPNSTSNNSVFVGAYTRSSASGNTNEVVIGANTDGHGSHTVTLGNGSVTGLYSMGAYTATTPNQPNMYVASDGQIMRSTTFPKIEAGNYTATWTTVTGFTSAPSTTQSSYSRVGDLVTVVCRFGGTGPTYAAGTNSATLSLPPSLPMDNTPGGYLVSGIFASDHYRNGTQSTVGIVAFNNTTSVLLKVNNQTAGIAGSYCTFTYRTDAP